MRMFAKQDAAGAAKAVLEKWICGKDPDSHEIRNFYVGESWPDEPPEKRLQKAGFSPEEFSRYELMEDLTSGCVASLLDNELEGRNLHQITGLFALLCEHIPERPPILNDTRKSELLCEIFNGLFSKQELSNGSSIESARNEKSKPEKNRTVSLSQFQTLAVGASFLLDEEDAQRKALIYGMLESLTGWSRQVIEQEIARPAVAAKASELRNSRMNRRFTKGAKVVYEGFDEMDDILCPHCGNPVSRMDEESEFRPKHCPECGTKLIY